MTAHRSSAADGPDDGRPAAAESSATPAAEAPASAADQPPETYPLPPGPDGYPIVGNTLAFVRDPFAFFDELATYGDVVRYRVAGRRFTTLLAPEYVERVLVEEPERFERYLFGDRGFDFAPEGILFSEGEQWRTQRNLMQPAFTVDRIRSYADTMVDHAERTADGWDDGQVVALNRAFSDLTLRILSSALFDIDADPNGDGEPITRAATVINERGDSRRLTTFLPYWLPTPGNIRYKRAMAAYRDRVDELIAERRAEDASNGDAGDGTDDGPATDTDLLSLLLRAENDGDTLSEAEIRDNLVTFLFAGHETTSLGLTYTCMLLAQHDEVATRLRRELETVLDGDAPRFEHVPRLEYTEQVIREAMRLYPPAYVQFRRATEDAVIGGYRIPEGTILSLPQFRLHTDERFYDAPEEFRPERWADGGVDGCDDDANTAANADPVTDTDAATDHHDRPEYAYFPFGGGPRHCIGMRFAMLEMQLVVATLVRQFDLTLVSDPEPELTVGATLQPDEDVTVRLHRRS